MAPNAEGGVFEARIGGKKIFSRKDAGRFPEITELKRLVRDRLRPAATSDTWIVSSLDGRSVRDPVHLPSQLDVQRGDATRVVVERSTTTPFQTLNYSG